MSVLTKNFLTKEDTASTPRSSWSAEGSALLAEALGRGTGSPQRARQAVRLRVHGESMLPALWPGDVVEIASCSIEDVRPGEIVLARREGRLFLHRLIAPCTPNGFRLRGDSMPGCDPQYPPEALLGKLVRRVDARRGVSSAALSRALGMLFCHSGAARRLALTLRSQRKASAGEFRNEFRNSESV
ncbi:MAG: S24/S26 family peptidase [Terriglobales bacterium]